jgi:hypothetical protein
MTTTTREPDLKTRFIEEIRSILRRSNVQMTKSEIRDELEKMGLTLPDLSEFSQLVDESLDQLRAAKEIEETTDEVYNWLPPVHRGM